MKPTESILEWFKDLPEDMQRDIAWSVLAQIPDYPKRDELLGAENLSQMFVDWLADKRGGVYYIAAKALIVRTLIDFFIMKNRGTKQGWERARETNEWILEDLTNQGQGDITEPIKKVLERMPFRQRQWIKIGEAWSELCSGSLSDESIQLWIDNNPPRIP